MLECIELSLQAGQDVRAAIGTTALQSAEVPEILRARLRDAARALGRAAVELGGIAAPPEPQRRAYTDEEMFQKIIKPQIRLPHPNVEVRGLTEIVIENDTTLIIRGEHITLSPRQLFIFNQFITTLSVVRTRDFIGRLFKKYKGKGERQAIYSEIVQLRYLLGLEVLQIFGAGSTSGFILSRAAYLTDIRNPDTVTSPAREPLPESELEPEPQEVKLELPEEPAREARTRPPALTNVAKPEVEEESPRVATGLKNVLRTERLVDTRPWHPAEHIAARVELPLKIVARFIERNRSRFGGEFLEPKRKVISGRQIEMFSPQFIDWATASLERAKAREAERAQNLDSD